MLLYSSYTQNKNAMTAHESSPIESPTTAETAHDVPNISELVEGLRQDGVEVAEIPVWGRGAVDIQPGKVGAIYTEGLNGCHVSVLTGRTAEGQRTLAMTHVPPGPGFDKKYRRHLRELAQGAAEEGATIDHAVTVVDRKVPEEVAEIHALFPSAELSTVSYNRLAPEHRTSPDAGQALAIIDFREPTTPMLYVASEVGTHMVPLGAQLGGPQ